MKSTQDILKQKRLTEREVLTLKRRANANKFVDADWDAIINSEHGITREQTVKGLKWLKSQWKSPLGRERKHNPFGSREQEILKRFSHFEFVGFIDDATMYQIEAGIHNYKIIYRVVARGGDSFEYVPYGGQYSAENKSVYIIG